MLQHRCRYSDLPIPATHHSNGALDPLAALVAASNLPSMWLVTRTLPSSAMRLPWKASPGPFRLRNTHGIYIRIVRLYDRTISLAQCASVQYPRRIFLPAMPRTHQVLCICCIAVCAYVLDSVSLSSQPCCLIFHQLGRHLLSSQFTTSLCNSHLASSTCLLVVSISS